MLLPDLKIETKQKKKNILISQLYKLLGKLELLSTIFLIAKKQFVAT